jgi:hypothetical protein
MSMHEGFVFLLHARGCNEHPAPNCDAKNNAQVHGCDRKWLLRAQGTAAASFHMSVHYDSPSPSELNVFILGQSFASITCNKIKMTSEILYRQE